ncbi:MAG TPA: hypothetical protein DDW34_12960 [Clostridium sp.]|nr:hypothetical protein [Clostridium sp.]
MKKLVVSPITNTIYWATVNEEKQMITGKKEDVTDNAVGAAFEWFMGNMKEFKDGKMVENAEHSISYEGLPFVLKMVRKEEAKGDSE